MICQQYAPTPPSHPNNYRDSEGGFPSLYVYY